MDKTGEERVLEIDGPPMAYFETPVGSQDIKRYMYRLFCWESKDIEDCIKRYEAFMRRVRRSLRGDLSLNTKHQTKGLAIVWRLRPEVRAVFDEEDNPTHCLYYRLRCRVTTIPDLLPAQWEYAESVENKTKGELMVEHDKLHLELEKHNVRQN